MSFERQTTSFTGESSPVSVYENQIEEHESLEVEVDLESPEGRSQLIQEIENLALTCDVADDPELFAQSVVFELVAALQTALTEIEHTQMLGEAITDVQAETVQYLYDQLAIEVEQPANISIYVGPSRKDMVLEDLSDDGSITITQTKQVDPEPKMLPQEETAEHTASFIHNSLPERPVVPVQSAQPEPAPQKRKTLYEADAPEIALQKIIAKIEATEVSFLDAWINDYQSPYKVLGDMPFAELKQLSGAPVNSRTYLEFKSLLEQRKIKYEVFNQWSQHFEDMEQAVDRATDKSFKQVIDEYLTSGSAS